MGRESKCWVNEAMSRILLYVVQQLVDLICAEEQALPEFSDVIF